MNLNTIVNWEVFQLVDMPSRADKQWLQNVCELEYFTETLIIKKEGIQS